MRPFVFAIEEKDRALIYETASRLDLPPTVFVRALVLRGLRKEIAKLDRESGTPDRPAERSGERTDQ